MKSKILIGEMVDKTAWAKFVETHPQGNVFQIPQMYDVYAHTEHMQPIVVAVTEGKEIVGILLAQYITNGSKATSWMTARSIIVGGPLAHNNDPAIIQALLDAYKNHRPCNTIYSEVRPVYSIDDISGWKRVGHYNIVLKVDKSEEELWAGMHKERRRNVGQAEKAGLRFEEVKDAAGCREVVALLRKTYERKHVPMADGSLFAQLPQIMPEYVHFFAAYYEDRMIAGQIRLGYKDLLYAWYAGSDEDYFKLRPNDFLMWYVIRWAHQNGYKEFDFGGGGEPGKPYGVRDYKLKYGCEMFDYGRYICAHRPIAYWLMANAYAVYRKIKGK